MSEALEELNESDIDYIIAQKKAKLADLAKKSRKRDLYKGVVVAGAGSLGLLAKNSTMFFPTPVILHRSRLVRNYWIRRAVNDIGNHPSR